MELGSGGVRAGCGGGEGGGGQAPPVEPPGWGLGKASQLTARATLGGRQGFHAGFPKPGGSCGRPGVP